MWRVVAVVKRLLADIVAVLILVLFFWGFDLSTYMAALAIAVYVFTTRG